MSEQHIIDAVLGGYYAGDWPQAARTLCKRITELEAEVIKARVRATNADRTAELAENAKRIAALEWICRHTVQLVTKSNEPVPRALRKHAEVIDSTLGGNTALGEEVDGEV